MRHGGFDCMIIIQRLVVDKILSINWDLTVILLLF